MHLWWIHRSAAPPTAPGDARHFALARHLVRRDHRVTLVCAAPVTVPTTDPHRGPAEPYGRSWWRQSFDQVEFLWPRQSGAQNPRPRRLWGLLAFANRVERLAARCEAAPDVVMATLPDLLTARAAERIAARWRVPFILEVLGWSPDRPSPNIARRHRHLATRARESIEHGVLLAARRVLTRTPDRPEHLLDWGAEPAKVLTLPYGVDLDTAWDPSPPPSRLPVVALCLSSDGSPRHAKPVVEAAALLRDAGHSGLVRFRVLCDAQPADKLADNLTVEPPVAYADRHAALQGVDLLLVSSGVPTSGERHHAPPGLLYECLAAGRPVIDATGATPSPVTQCHGGITVSADDPQALAEAVMMLCALPPAVRWEMGGRGRAFIVEHHDAARIADTLETILEEAVVSVGGAV